MKRVWIISRFYAEETGTGYVLTRTAEGLTEHFSVNVLCGQPDYVHHERRAPLRENVNGVTIIRVRSTGFSNKSLLIKMLNMVSGSLLIFFKTLQNVGRDEPVLIVNLPPLLPFLALIACRIKRAKTMLLIHDVYPDTLVATAVQSQAALSTRIAEWMFKRLYRSVDRIVVLGRDMQALIAKKLRSDPNDILVIPNTTDVECVYPLRRDENVLLRELGLESKFVLKYAGHMGRTHGLELLTEAARRIAAIDPQIHFLFLGDGPKKQWLTEEVARHELGNVSVEPYWPRAQIVSSINACDVGLISMMPGMVGVSVPSRMYDLLAAGKPVIVIAEMSSELALMTQEEKIGWVVSPNDIDALVKAIQEAKANPRLLAEMSVHARKIAEEKYARRHQIDAYCNLILSLDVA